MAHLSPGSVHVCVFVHLCTAVVPMFAKERVFEWLTSDQFADLSVSRPSTRLPWGIPVPGDSTQTVGTVTKVMAALKSIR